MSVVDAAQKHSVPKRTLEFHARKKALAKAEKFEADAGRRRRGEASQENAGALTTSSAVTLTHIGPNDKKPKKWGCKISAVQGENIHLDTDISGKGNDLRATDSKWKLELGELQTEDLKFCPDSDTSNGGQESPKQKEEEESKELGAANQSELDIDVENTSPTLNLKESFREGINDVKLSNCTACGEVFNSKDWLYEHQKTACLLRRKCKPKLVHQSVDKSAQPVVSDPVALTQGPVKGLHTALEDNKRGLPVRDSAKMYGVSKIAIGNRSIAEAHRVQKTAPEVASANNNSNLLSQANIRQLEHQRWTALLTPKSPSPPYQQHHPSAPSSYEYISGETEMPPQHLSIQEGETALGFLTDFVESFRGY